jgi:hypothetical protein
MNFIKVILVNILISYLLVFIVNAIFDYRNYHKSYYYTKKQQIESLARAKDKVYYHQCLRSTYKQALYPDIHRLEKWKHLANKYGFLPLGAQPNRQITYCNEGYGFVTYKTDRHGFRNEDSLWDSKIDILLIGDSFTQGACVLNNLHILARLNLHSKYSTINVGSGSNGPHHYVNMIKTFVPLVTPKYAVILFYPNDNTSISKDDPYLKAYLSNRKFDYTKEGVGKNGQYYFEAALKELISQENETKYETNCNIESDYFKEDNQKSQYSLKLYNKIFTSDAFTEWKKYHWKDYFKRLWLLQYSEKVLLSREKENHLNNIPKMTVEAVDILFESCKVLCTPVIVFLPNSEYWRPDSMAKSYFNIIRKYLYSTKNIESFLLIDVSDEFEKHEDSEVYALSGPHFSPKGYKIVSDKLLEAISNHNQLH